MSGAFIPIQRRIRVISRTNLLIIKYELPATMAAWSQQSIRPMVARPTP